MLPASEGAVCDSCFLGCRARLCGGEWRFRCRDALRRYAEAQRALGYPDDFRREDDEALAAMLRAMRGD